MDPTSWLNDMEGPSNDGLQAVQIKFLGNFNRLCRRRVIPDQEKASRCHGLAQSLE